MVVLSNNDGCAIARSAEAKRMGVKMGQPFFQFQHLVKQGLIVRSANFPLYANLSERIVSVLETLAFDVVPYSIDESFLDLTGISSDLTAYGQYIRNIVYRHTRMPVGVGVAETKTLAKAANWATKHFPAFKGVVSIYQQPERRAKMLSMMPVGEVWGVGKQMTRHFESMKIKNAYQLSQMDPEKVRKQFNVVIARTVAELQGIESVEWESDIDTNRQIISSKSIGTKTDDKHILFSAITRHVSNACKKLRKQNAVAQYFSLFYRTSRFNTAESEYSVSESLPLSTATDDTREFLKLAHKIFDETYRKGFRYAKAGCVLSSITPKSQQQSDLFCNDEKTKQSEKTMNVLDALNAKFGKSTIRFGGEDLNCASEAKSQWRSQNYMSDWADIPKLSV